MRKYRNLERTIYKITALCLAISTTIAVMKIIDDSKSSGAHKNNNSLADDNTKPFTFETIETRSTEVLETIAEALNPIIEDTTPPVISGARDMEVFIGDPDPFLDGITVTDDRDASPELVVDSSAVLMDTEGTYPLIYTAYDDNGNTSSVTVNVTVRVRPERYYEPEVLYELASDLNSTYGIYSDTMTDVQKAFRIFNWVHTNMRFEGVSDRTDWTCAAYDGLTTLKGDSYGYSAVCRAFLDMEGIQNLYIERYPLTWSEHSWNLVLLNGTWYHCDALGFSAPCGYYFMCADSDFDTYDHQYDQTAYDHISIAQASVQQYVHYDTLEADI